MGLRVLSIICLMIGSFQGTTASARSFRYPQERYHTAESESLGGVTVSLTEEVGNMLMNNPAGLARYTGFRAEPLNINVGINSNVLSNIGLNSFTLGGLSSTVNAKPYHTFGMGMSNLTAVSWGGFGVGLLYQEFSRVTSDGTNGTTEAVSQLVPSVGYGFGLARNIMRIGYSLQYVNEVSGSATSALGSSSTFFNGLKKGSGFSHNASINFAFPFSYLPTFSILARNLAGLTYSSGGLGLRGTNISGVPSSQAMSIDLAFDFLVRLSGTTKSHWYLQYRDLTGASSMPFLEKMSVGLDVSLTQNFGIRAGLNGLLFSGGIGYHSDLSDINLAYYNEPSPFGSSSASDTRYALQYKIRIQGKAKKVEGGPKGGFQ